MPFVLPTIATMDSRRRCSAAIGRALEVAKRIECGICHINASTVHDEAQMPFGGTKAFGLRPIWRPGGHRGIHRVAWITIATGPQELPVLSPIAAAPVWPNWNALVRAAWRHRGRRPKSPDGCVRLHGRAVCRRLPCRLERRHQARARSARDHCADLDRRRVVGLAALPFVGIAGHGGLALGDRLGADPSLLFRGADRELPRGRHEPSLSDRARLGAADDRDRDHACWSASASALSAGAGSCCWPPACC